MGAVEEYLEALPARDWPRLAATLSDDGLVRDGPFVDVVKGKDAYVEFLRRVVSPFKGYRLDVSRISLSGDRVVFVELTEVLEIDGTPTGFPELILFELDDAGFIRYVSVFMKRPGGEPSVGGGRAS